MFRLHVDAIATTLNHKLLNLLTKSRCPYTHAHTHTATTGCPPTPEVVSHFQKYVLQRLSKDGLDEMLRCVGICYRGGSCGHVAPTGSQWRGRTTNGWRSKNISYSQNVSWISFGTYFLKFHWGDDSCQPSHNLSCFCPPQRRACLSLFGLWWELYGGAVSVRKGKWVSDLCLHGKSNFQCKTTWSWKTSAEESCRHFKAWIVWLFWVGSASNDVMKRDQLDCYLTPLRAHPPVPVHTAAQSAYVIVFHSWVI